jgi:mannose-6-phosphate isomerase-like protein (cupin superfamily)
MSRLMIASLVSLSVLTAAQTARTPVTHVSAGDIAATLARVPPTAVSDQQIRVVDAGGYHVGVGVLHRPEGAVQNAIEHHDVTEVYYVLEGAGTLMTGGSLVGGAELASDNPIVRELVGPSASAKAIQGGESRRITVGDVVIIPAGVPHWLGRVEGTIRYLVVRMDPQRRLALK